MFYYNLIQYFASSSEDDELLSRQAEKINSEEEFDMSITTKLILASIVTLLLILGAYFLNSTIKENATLTKTNVEITQVNTSNVAIAEKKNAAQQEIAKGITNAVEIVKSTAATKETVVATIKAVEEKAKAVQLDPKPISNASGSKTSVKQEVVKEPVAVIGRTSAQSLVELSNIIDAQIASLPDL